MVGRARGDDAVVLPCMADWDPATGIAGCSTVLKPPEGRSKVFLVEISLELSETGDVNEWLSLLSENATKASNDASGDADID